MSQADLEAEMQSLGVARTKKRQARAIERGLESTTAGGTRFMRELPKTLVAAIEEWKVEAGSRPGIRHKALGKLEDRDTRTIVALALRVILDSLSHARGYSRTAMQIATRLEDEERYAAFKEQSSIDFHHAVRRADDFSSYGEKRRHILTAMTLFGFDRPKWSEDMKAAVGVVLLELAVVHTGLLQVSTIRHSARRTELRIQATPEAIEWMESANEQQAEMSPLYLPFIAEPLDWIDPMSGGFHSTNCFASTIVKTSDSKYIAELQRADMPWVYSAVNVLQRTSWTINPHVFEMFSYLWENSYEAVGLPVRDDGVVPPKPPNIKIDVTARKEWRKAARAIHDANHRHSSDRMAASRLHWVAKKYREESKFYFCHQLDWRGRAYPVSYYLQPQGTDIVKGLLQFGEGKPVTTPDALRWHAIHGANCWGLDKKPFAERQQWVNDSEEWLLRIAEDPLACRDWEGADKPWMFLAWCIDWVQILEDPDHVSHLPIHQDATQSGIQIYSLLLRDLEGAKATNCVPSETPQDLYGLVCDRLVAALLQEKSAGVELAAKWLEFGLDRTACKRPVMTRVYNATKHSARTYLQEWAVEKANREGKPLPKVEGKSAYWYLANQLWDAMAEVTASTSMAQAWFSEIAQIFAEQRKPIRWTSPLGLPIRQFYPGYDHHCVRTLIGERYRQTSLRTPNTAVNARRMRAAFAPNVVHSLDAAAMMQTVNTARADGVTAITCNHDSYATLAADSAKLAKATRTAYVELFSGDLLTNLRTELQAQMPPNLVLPEVPTFGTLDVKVLRDSPYFFS